MVTKPLYIFVTLKLPERVQSGQPSAPALRSLGTRADPPQKLPVLGPSQPRMWSRFNGVTDISARCCLYIFPSLSITSLWLLVVHSLMLSGISVLVPSRQIWIYLVSLGGGIVVQRLAAGCNPASGISVSLHVLQLLQLHSRSDTHKDRLTVECEHECCVSACALCGLPLTI